MKSCKAESICILMLNSPNIPLYAHKATMINYMYAARHGYNFVVERCPRPEDINKPWMWDEKRKYEYLLVWSKPTLIRKHMPFYDYILFIDSDAIVIDHNKTVESFIKQHMTDATCIIAAQDCKKTDDCWVAKNLNTGVMLFKNSTTTLTLLDAWFEATNNVCKHTLYTHPREQECLNILKKQKYNDLIKILPISVMGGYDGTWIQHYAGMPNPEREKIITGHLHKELKSFEEDPIIEGFSGSTCLANKGMIDTNPVELFIIAGVFIVLCFILASFLQPKSMIKV